MQNNIALPGIVKSSMQVGAQGELTPYNQRNIDCHVSKQFVLGGMDRMKPMVLCLDYFVSNKV